MGTEVRCGSAVLRYILLHLLSEQDMHYFRAFLTPVLAALMVTVAFAGDKPFLRGMVGTWDVQQRMWSGPDIAPVELPAAVAHRELIDGKYLAEIMQPAAGDVSGKGMFRRD